MDWQRLVRERLSTLDLDLSRESAIVEELAQDLEARYADALDGGRVPAEAVERALEGLDELARALREVERPGVPALLREQAGREDALVAGAPRQGRWLADLRQDLRYAIRALSRRPLFAAVAILSLALGAGAAAATFGILEAVLLRPLPYADPDGLVHLFETQPGAEALGREASYPDFLDLKAGDTGFVALGGYNGGSVTLTVGDQPDRVRVVQATDNLFALLGIEPALGRGFLPGESGPAAAPVVILTDGAWRSRFGAAADIVGRTISLDGRGHTVIGVLPREFHFPLRGDGELWVPLELSPRQVERRYMHWLDVVGRLAPGVTLEQARERTGRVMRSIADLDPRWHEDAGVRLVPLHELIVGRVRPGLVTALVAVGFLLLVTCSNLAGLMLARASERRREFAVRCALGARPSRMLRQLLVESLLLGVVGGALGLLVALWGARLAVGALPAPIAASLPHLVEFRLHPPAFAVALAATVATTVLFGLVPALTAARVQPVEALRDGRSGGGTRGRGRLRRTLVVAEIASALVLLAAAGLLGKSLERLLATPAGFDTRDLLTFRLSPPATWNGEPDELWRLHRELLERVETLPGVDAAATVSQLPLTGYGNTGTFRIESRPGGASPEAHLRGISDGYFHTLGIPLLAGRTFRELDRADSPPVVLVNRTLAKKVFGEGNPVGQRISFVFFEGEPWWEIVGIVDDERVGSLATDVTPIVYFSQRQDIAASYSLVVRSREEPGRLGRRVEAAVHAIDSGWPVYAERTMTSIVEDSMPVFLRRYLSRLLAAFSIVAVAVAGVGVYGIVALAVAARRREIGIRVALGARPRQVVAIALGEGTKLVAAGIVVGLAAATLAGRAAEHVLYRVSASDPAVLTTVALSIAGVALAASVVPIGRALRFDPAWVLREE